MNLVKIVAFAVWFFCLASGTLGQDSTDFAWTPEKMIGLEEVNDPVISPDSKWVAYEVRSTLMDAEESSFRTQVWVAATDGSMNRQFTRGDKSSNNPRFTADGKALTFTSSRNNDKSQIYRIYLNGGEAEQLTHAENGVNSYQWSPDGSQIAYTMTDPKSKEEKKQEKEKRDVVLVDKNYHFSRLYVKNIDDDTTTTQIAAGDFQITSFDWSPDGSQIVFSHQPTPKIDDGRKSDISMVPADSGAVTALVEWEGADGNPLFSKDGSYIVFQSSGGAEEPVGLTDIYRVSTEGGSPQALGQTPNRSASILEWGPDGNSLLVAEANNTFTTLYKLPINGDQAEKITPDDGVYSDFDLSDNGRHLSFIFEQPSTPPNVYTSLFDSFNKKQLTNIYKDVEFPEMGKTELLRWESKDGMQVEGLLTYPAGYEKGEKVPLILNVHGGPAGVYSQSWTGGGSIYPIQYFADQGFAVLRPNPRGSTGYGKEFRYANIQDWGFGDYEDLMSGVDKVIEMGVADAENLFEMGWSYGGYMTSFIITKTDRFNAVSMGAGLPNLISMVNTTDISSYLVGHMGGYYWESEEMEETYERHSAIYRLDEISTPTQIIHGLQDDRVPTSQGREFYWALQERGVPSELILYPRTPHGPREPKFIADVPTRIMSWFKQYMEE